MNRYSCVGVLLAIACSDAGKLFSRSPSSASVMCHLHTLCIDFSMQQQLFLFPSPSAERSLLIQRHSHEQSSPISSTSMISLHSLRIPRSRGHVMLDCIALFIRLGHWEKVDPSSLPISLQHSFANVRKERLERLGIEISPCRSLQALLFVSLTT